jgi:FlaA1/EpsC-like NDP-sugar epimerase
LTQTRHFRYERAIKGEPSRRRTPGLPFVRKGARRDRPRRENGEIELLLGRPARNVGGGDAAAYLNFATVVVTGAAGSIGAELCRRVVRAGARRLVLVEQAEAPLVELAGDLGDAGVEVVPVLADVRSLPRALDVFERHRPDIVFHAAAYKQVPLLEEHPVEAVATNVLGTAAVVAAALRAGVPRLVFFSTDKAVEATSILGRTKAAAEWIVASAGRENGAAYTSIRLGNVVDSAGSILPRFRRQLECGAALTVTDPQATRYVMTAGEAAGLAIAAGSLAEPEVVFLLDCGPPVQIVDLARRLARAHHVEARIEVIGLRPGERLHERLCRDDAVVKTAFPYVLCAPAERIAPEWLDRRIAALARHAERASAAGVRAALAELLEPAPVQLSASVTLAP